jgi:hypothetical protein
MGIRNAKPAAGEPGADSGEGEGRRGTEREGEYIRPRPAAEKTVSKARQRYRPSEGSHGKGGDRMKVQTHVKAGMKADRVQ